MRQGGFVTILILFTVFILMLIVGWLGFDNYYTNKVLAELKQEKALLQNQLNICNIKPEDDKRIYWFGEDAFICSNSTKILDINSLISYISKGFVNKGCGK